MRYVLPLSYFVLTPDNLIPSRARFRMCVVAKIRENRRRYDGIALWYATVYSTIMTNANQTLNSRKALRIWPSRAIWRVCLEYLKSSYYSCAIASVRHATDTDKQIPRSIAKFMGPTWGPPGSCRPQMGPMLATWTLLSGDPVTHN